MKSTTQWVLFAGAWAGLAACAHAVPFAVEGKLAQVNVEPSSLALLPPVNTVLCNGTLIYLTAATEYSTPTGSITTAQLISGTPWPGRASVAPAAPLRQYSKDSAFIGGTCIIEGDDDGSPAGRRASKLFVEPAENVLVGPTTNESGQPFAIMGVPVVLLASKPSDGTPLPAGYVEEPEGRIIATPPVNAANMKIRLDTVPKNDESSAEGYLGDDGKIFYAFAVETTGGTLAEPKDFPTASVQRGDVTFSSATTVKLEVRGGCTFLPTTARPLHLVVQVDRGNAWVNATGGTSATAVATTCAEDPATPGSGTYRYRNDRFAASATPVPGTIPTKVRVAPAVTPAEPLNFSDAFTLNRLGFR